MQEKLENTKNDNSFSLKLTGILDIIICLLLFISSIYKGSFYKADFLFPNALICITGAVYLIYKIIIEITNNEKDKKPKSKVKIVLDIFMLLIPFIYMLPILFRTYVSLTDSIYEMLRYVNMSIIYFIVRSSKNEKIYFDVLTVIAFVQMVLGIDQITTRNFEELLNNISTGYLNDTDRLSGTIQYANVTGTVITLGTLICFNKISKLLKKEGKIKHAELLIYTIVFLLGISSILLTKSRVAILVVYGALILLSIFNYIYISKKNTIYLSILTIYSAFVSGAVENLSLSRNKAGIYITIIIASIIFVTLSILIKRLYIVINKKIESNIKLASNKKNIKVLFVVLSVILVILIFKIPKNIVIENNNNNNEYICITKNIYNFKIGENKLDFKVKGLNEDNRFKIKVKSINHGFREKVLKEYNYYDNTSWKFKDSMDVPEDTRRIEIDITVQKGKIEIQNFKLNNKKVALSYMFFGSSALNKLKDTFSGVYGDTLRLAYAKDSIKLLKNSLAIGVGGEGFKYTYGTVQETGYISSEAHSALLQSLVEVGVIGTAVLLTIIVTSFAIALKLIVRLNKMTEEDRHKAILIILLYLSNLATVIFDLAFSYAFMIYIFAILTAILIKTYFETVLKAINLDDKVGEIDWSYIRIIILSLSFVTLSCATYFSLNAYRASIITVPNNGSDISATEVAENIAYLELKNKYDKFDIDYMQELNAEYNKYKSMLTEAIVSAYNDKQLKEELKEEKNSLIVSIKDNVDKMLEYSYYDKYVLKEVADTYIQNYMTFAEIYKKQFSNEEVAYAFYLHYVLKLTDRIIELSPYSKKANEMYNDMCKEYLESLKKDNKYLNSNAVEYIIQELNARIEK